ncbi:MAG TPA: D-glycerate dehydrogenase [Anaerolineaceae bacterium]|nr:D-glycerate dehydrogenase [Anaerolineaceae bacterium]
MLLKPSVFVTRQIDPVALDKLAKIANVEVWNSDSPPPREILMEKLRTVNGIITLLTDSIDEEIISSASHDLRVISQMAVGYDNINIQMATRRKIPVGNTPGVLTETTADFTWALLMAIARRVPEGDREVHQGIWRPWGPNVLTGQDVFGSSLGIVGFGRIGQAVARRAIGFQMKVRYFDVQRYPELETELNVQYASLSTLLSQSDFVTLHINLNPSSHHLIGREELGIMKPTAYLINTARGGIVDSEALYDALKFRQIAGAAIDVFETEPIPAHHPILELDNLIITPHIASASKQTRARMAMIAVNNVIAGINGEHLPHCVNPEVYQS